MEDLGENPWNKDLWLWLWCVALGEIMNRSIKTLSLSINMCDLTCLRVVFVLGYCLLRGGIWCGREYGKVWWEWLEWREWERIWLLCFIVSHVMLGETDTVSEYYIKGSYDTWLNKRQLDKHADSRAEVIASPHFLHFSTPNGPTIGITFLFQHFHIFLVIYYF